MSKLTQISHRIFMICFQVVVIVTMLFNCVAPVFAQEGEPPQGETPQPAYTTESTIKENPSSDAQVAAVKMADSITYHPLPDCGDVVPTSSNKRLLVLLQGLGSNTDLDPSSNRLAGLSGIQKSIKNWEEIVTGGTSGQPGIGSLYGGILYLSYSPTDSINYHKEDSWKHIEDNVQILHDTIELCHGAGWETFDLVGHSMGGVVASVYGNRFALNSEQGNWVKHIVPLDSPVNGSLWSQCLNAGGGACLLIPNYVSYIPLVPEAFKGTTAAIDLGGMALDQKQTENLNLEIAKRLYSRHSILYRSIKNNNSLLIRNSDAAVGSYGLTSTGDGSFSRGFDIGMTVNDSHGDQDIGHGRIVSDAGLYPDFLAYLRYTLCGGPTGTANPVCTGTVPDPGGIPTPLPPPNTPNSDQATFITDRSIPDGSIVSPNQSLTKTWRLQNSGFTTWGSGYQLVFTSGEKMGAPETVDVPSTAPGQTVDISVNIVAPSKDGTHKGYWRMRNPQGTFFGDTIWVKVGVNTNNAGSGQIMMFDVSPASPASTNSIHLIGRILPTSNFRSMRFKMGGEVIEMPNPRWVGDQYEVSTDWNTSNLVPGNYTLVFEVANVGDNSWSNPEREILTYTLTGSGTTNHPPERPGLKSPYNWYLKDASGSSASVELCVHPVSDPDSDLVQYYFEVKDQGGGVYANSGWVSNTCWSYTYNPNTYSWRVKAGDGNAESDWSTDTWNFSVAKGGVYIGSHSFFQQNTNETHMCVYVTYDGIQGPDVHAWINDAADNSENGEWHMLDHYGPNTTPDCTDSNYHGFWIRSPYYTTGTHKIKVSAVKPDSGANATMMTSLTIDYMRPANPTALAPSSATNNGTQWNNRTIDFTWTPSLRAESYTLRVSTIATPWDDPSPLVNQVLSADTTSYSYTFNQDYSKLYWSVRATNSAGNSDSGNDIWFGIDKVVPTCHVQALANSTFETVFQVNWSGTDNSAGVRSYDIQYMDSDRGTWETWLASKPSTKTYELFTGTEGHTYYFRCRSTDYANNTNTYPVTADTSIVVDLTSRPATPWWDSGYANKRNITVLNNMAGVNLPTGFPVHLSFNSTTSPTAAEIYDASLASTKCNDVRIVSNDTTELNRVVQSCTSSAIDIWFRTSTSVNGGSSNNTTHQLYYGNASPGDPPADPNQVWYPYKESDTKYLYFFQEGTGSTTYDSSGYGHNCSINSSVQWQPSLFGNGLRFNRYNSGDSRSLNCGSATSLSSFTVEFWYKPDSDDAGRIAGELAGNGNGGGGNNWLISIEGGYIRVDIWEGTSNLRSKINLLNSPYVNQWNHVAVTFNGTNEVKIYINGVLDATRYTTPNGINTYSPPLEIGSSEGIGQIKANLGAFRISSGVKTSFPYGSFSSITTPPSLLVGNLVAPPVTGEPDLSILDMVAYPNTDGGYVVQVTVENIGNLATQNGFYTDLYLDHLPTGARDYSGSVSFWVNDSIDPNEVVTLTAVISEPGTTTLQSQSAQSETTAMLYAQTDSMGIVKEPDNNNNIYTTGVPVCFANADIYEADNTTASATTIQPGQTQSHNFHHIEDQDWLKFTAEAGTTYHISTSNLSNAADTYLYLFDEDGTTLLTSNDDYEDDLSSKIIWIPVTSGTYYLLIEQWNPSIGGCGTSYDVAITSINLPSPVLISPADKSFTASSTPNLLLHASTGANRYQYQLATDPEFSNIVIDVTKTATNYTLLSSEELEFGTYYWRARAMDQTGNMSQWSSPNQFSVTFLFKPTNEGYLVSTKPTFTWKAVKGALEYHLQVDETDTFTTPEVDRYLRSGTSIVSPILDLGTHYWRMQVRTANGWSGWAPAWQFTFTSPLSSPPNLVSPKNAALLTEDTPTLTWDRLYEDDHYELQIDDLKTFSSPVQNYIADTGENYTAAPLSDGLYYWRIRSINYLNVPGVWSAYRSFTIDTTPPFAPVLSKPFNEDSLIGTPSFTWMSSTSAQKYQFEYDNDTDFSSPTYTSGDLTARKHKPPTMEPGAYSWHVRAKDKAGNWSEWSSPRLITILPTIPPAPILTAPGNGSAINNPSPDFIWNSVVTANTYEIEISKTKNFTLKSQEFSGSHDTLSFTSSALEDGIYYWHVRAINVNNIPGKWSACRSFTIDTTPPVAPALSKPADIATITGTPSFIWLTTSTAIRYQFKYDNDSDFSSPTYTSGELKTLKHKPPTMEPGTYSWHVRAMDKAGNWSEWSSPRKITIQPTTPSAPILTAPSNASTLNDSTPELTWNSAVYGNTYELEISDTKKFTSLLQSFTGESGVLNYTSSVLEDGIYYWHVRAINVNNITGPWSAYRSFTIDTTPPIAPALSKPADNSTITETPSFVWLTTSTAIRYQFEYDNDSDFSSPTYTSSELKTLKHKPPTMEPGTYSWHVRAKDKAGNWSEWSSPYTVIIILLTLNAPILISPENGSISQDPAPVLKWNSSTNAVSYQVQVDNNSTFTNPEFDNNVNTTEFSISYLENGIYYWRVAAVNGEGAISEWSLVWRMTINQPTIAIPTLLLPADLSTESTDLPTFSWENVENATNYQIQIDNEIDFSSPVFDNVSVDTSQTPELGLNDGIYYWRVRAINTFETPGEWSEVRTLTINIPPAIPTLLLPDNNSTDNTGLPTFIWESVEGADNYEIQVDNDNDFNSPIIDNITAEASITPESGLSDGTYFWRVRAINSNETPGDWSSVWTVNITIP